MRSTIRLRIILSFLPVLVASLTIVGATSLLIARSGMIRLAMRTMVFKAETLKQFGEAQWRLLETQGLSGDAEFVAAAKTALVRHARSLLREDSEWILALELDGTLALSARKHGMEAFIPEDLVQTMQAGITGPIRFGTGPIQRYGQAFYLEPFGWYMVNSDTAESIFAETRRLSNALLLALAISVLVALGMLFALSASISRPIVGVSVAIGDILKSNDFARSLKPESDDEIGMLTLHFNTLCGEIDRSWKRIGDIAAREIEARTEVVERDIEALAALGKVSEFRDEETSNHTLRVGLYADILASHFYPDASSRRVLVHAAPMHDLGKVGIPDAILLKPGKLDAAEFEFMKTHTIIGYEILREFRNPFLAMGAEISLSHHEHWDGAGYPKGLSGQAIPLSGRILAVLDVFDALISNRPYKRAWTVDEAFAHILDQRGRHFDPVVVDAFIQDRAKIELILETHH